MEDMQGFTREDAAIEEKEYWENLAKDKRKVIESSTNLNNTQIREKVHYLGELRIVGQIIPTKSAKNPVGYVVMNEKTKRFKAYTVDQTKSLLQKFKFVNAEYNSKSGNIDNTECSMTAMPKYNMNLQVIDNFGVIVLGEIVVNDKAMGYRVIDTKGKVVDLKETDLIILSERGTPVLNAKVVTKNTKQYISAIKKEFTKIEKSVAAPPIKSTDSKFLWRCKRHIATYEEEFFPRALAQLFTQRYHCYFNSKLFHFSYDDYDNRDRIVHRYVKEIEIIKDEVLVEENGYKLSDADKKLIEKIASEFLSNPKEDTFNDTFGKLSQFALTNKNVRETFLKRYMKGPRIRHVDYQKAEDFSKEGICSAMFENYMKFLNNKMLEYTFSSKRSEEATKKFFNTVNFSSGRNIAQIGFVLDRNIKENFREDGYHYVTDCGYKLKLKCVEDCFDDFLDDGTGSYIYSTIKDDARCLGDILAVADVEKLARKLSGREHWKWHYITKDEVKCMIEIIVAISYLYDSVAMKKYLEMFNGEVKKNIENLIGRQLPDYEEISTTDYKLSKQLRTYYDSGFNVYYQMDSPVNFRRQHNSVQVDNPEITGELASIVNMITSDECDCDMINRCITHLRFF